MEDDSNSITMVDVLKEQEAFEEDAEAVLGASDDKNCTYLLGYVKRQALYACLTCCPDSTTNAESRAGICLACSLACHENHNLVELYTKRNFRCDCAGPKFPNNTCTFNSKKLESNEQNGYNQNFSGFYCTCHRPYPDPDDTVEDEMIQCVICEDWFHSRHLNTSLPAAANYSEMICEGCTDSNEFLENYLCYEASCNTSIEKTSEEREIDVEKINESSFVNESVDESMVQNEEAKTDGEGKDQEYDQSNHSKEIESTIGEVNSELSKNDVNLELQTEVTKIIDSPDLQNETDNVPASQNLSLDGDVPSADAENQVINTLCSEMGDDVAIDKIEIESSGIKEQTAEQLEDNLDSVEKSETNREDSNILSSNLDNSAAAIEDTPISKETSAEQPVADNIEESHIDNVQSEVVEEKCDSESILNNDEKLINQEVAIEKCEESMVADMKDNIPDVKVGDDVTKSKTDEEKLESDNTLENEQQRAANITESVAMDLDGETIEEPSVHEHVDEEIVKKAEDQSIVDKIQEQVDSSKSDVVMDVDSETPIEDVNEIQANDNKCTESNEVQAAHEIESEQINEMQLENVENELQPEENTEKQAIDEKQTEESSEMKAIDEKQTEESSEMQAIDEKQTEESNEMQAIDEKQTEESSEMQAIDEKQTEESNEMQAIEKKQTEECSEMQAIDEKQTEESSEMQAIDKKQTEESSEMQAIDEKQTEESNEMQAIDEKQTEESSEMQAIDKKQTEESSEMQAIDEKQTEESSEMRTIDEKQPEQGSDVECVDKKLTEPVSEMEIVDETNSKMETDNQVEQASENVSAEKEFEKPVDPQQKAADAENSELTVPSVSDAESTKEEVLGKSTQVETNKECHMELSNDFTDNSTENNSNAINIIQTNDASAVKRKQDNDNCNGNQSPMKKKIKQEKIYLSECIKPTRNLDYKRKGATFWPSDWRSKLCSCRLCVDMYNEKNVSFILDLEDTVSAYEDLGKIKTESSSSQYEKGMEALSSLGHIQQINAITEYNKMKEKLLEFLKTFKDKKEVVKEEDIKGFFAGMKPKREPDGVYFCR